MTPSLRDLAFVLTFWVVAWPAASIRTRSPDSGWWGTQEALALRQATRAPALTGDFAESERIYRDAADLAVQPRDSAARAGLGSSLINTENFPSQYSLIHVHKRLRDFEAPLSFGMRERESFLCSYRHLRLGSESYTR
jgi:hypothetical protein